MTIANGEERVHAAGVDEGHATEIDRVDVRAPARDLAAKVRRGRQVELTTDEDRPRRLQGGPGQGLSSANSDLRSVIDVIVPDALRRGRSDQVATTHPTPISSERTGGMSHPLGYFVTLV
jgi:hypothetical protein